MFYGLLVGCFFKVRVIASFDCCSRDEGISFTAEMKLYLTRQEIIVDMQRQNGGMILTQRRIFLLQRLLHSLCIVILLEI